jgi:hypothetical protein
MAQTNTCTDPSLINVSMPWERMQNALAHAVGRTAESQYSHLRDVRDEIWMTAFAFSHLNHRRLSATFPASTPTPPDTMRCRTFCAHQEL